VTRELAQNVFATPMICYPVVVASPSRHPMS